jgi:hypothetical protein
MEFILALAIIFLAYKAIKRIFNVLKVRRFVKICENAGVKGDIMLAITDNASDVIIEFNEMGKNPKYDHLAHEQLHALALKRVQDRKGISGT